jgi:hypothetical protein
MLSYFREKYFRGRSGQFHTKAHAGQSPFCMQKRQYDRHGRRIGSPVPPLLSARQAWLTRIHQDMVLARATVRFRTPGFR